MKTQKQTTNRKRKFNALRVGKYWLLSELSRSTETINLSSAESAPIMIPKVPKPCPQLEGPRGRKSTAQAGLKLEIRYIWDDETDRNGECLSELESSRFAGDIKNPPNTIAHLFAVWSYFYKDHSLLNVISEWNKSSPTPLSPNPSMDRGHKSFMIKDLLELKH